MQDPWTHTTDWPRIIGVVLLVIGALALIAGIVYLVLPAHSLPSIMGQLPKDYHRTKRGYTGLVVGIVLGAIGGFLLFRSRRAA
jgi:hypothetical protein